MTFQPNIPGSAGYPRVQYLTATGNQIWTEANRFTFANEAQPTWTFANNAVNGQLAPPPWTRQPFPALPSDYANVP
jgi:hypothetical protein